MSRQLSIKVYSRNNGTVDIRTMSVEGNPGEALTKFFCVDDVVFKYEILNEFGDIIDSQDISTVTPGSSSSVGVATTSTWETLTACCNSNWLLTEDTENIIGDQNSNPIILS